MAKTTTKGAPPKGSTPKGIVYYATGKRKTSAARVFLKPGTGVVTVNTMAIDKYLPTEVSLVKALLPLAITDNKGKFDAEITVAGGGKSGQAGAICHGLTRALLVADGEKLRPVLKKAGLVTRDDRMVERKKYGLHKARKKGQYSKR